MIKAKLTLQDDRPCYLFGLSALNLQKLRDGRPMVIDLEPMGGAGQILIMFGDTEADLLRELGDLIGPETQVHGLKNDAH
jgi:hypothetical protein